MIGDDDLLRRCFDQIKKHVSSKSMDLYKELEKRLSSSSSTKEVLPMLKIVRIKAFDVQGVIVQRKHDYDRGQNEYLVRYAMDGSIQFAWLFESDVDV